MISVESLEAQRQGVESAFNAAKAKKEQAQAVVDEQAAECLRLQGEHRRLAQLIQSESIPVDAGEPAPSVRGKNDGKETADVSK